MIKLEEIKIKLTLILVATFLLLWISAYVFLAKRQEAAAIQSLRHQAEGIYHTILLSRHWISSHGGIYVKNGTQYTLITPSHFVSKLTNYAKVTNFFPYSVKIAVEKPKNPAHLPDYFEKKALKFLKQKQKAIWALEKHDEEIFFRYAAPLKFKTECTHCHLSMQNNSLGCISIKFRATDTIKNLKVNKMIIAGYTFLPAIAIFSLIFFWLHRLVLKPLKIFEEAANSIAQGNYRIRVNINTKDEWGRFAKQFNIMISKIENHQKELEEKVREATQKLQKVYEDFFANITHDLKTPITAIKGASEILSKKNLGEPYTTIIRKNVEKLNLLIEDILECTKLESGSIQLQKEIVDLGELLEDVLLSLNLLAEERKVKLKLKMANRDVELSVFCDPAKLQRAFANILHNAIKFSPSGGVVTIEVEPKEGKVEIKIMDQGPGIPEDLVNKVFDKFAKGKDSKGLGLGLTISKAIIEQHQGKVEISSIPGKGTTVIVTLPLTKN
ncbi:two-component system sensor histidine kinase [Thermosulfidibacter takaii ABI70S6]|uniref:histidine kinase n=1 Tax=Thermosulfidibacter takaii (strain DSM 17441 / JCM 13301 / NBRC 103674 / ABI70S6) TaxID=1298851 RepID=A0A0S3QUK7_THET7|nr:ATP-binding protein [Thermosulfidibacter takaii]BAT72014.1 two-component system sensor histidine kinase [Thermosulfidibacter takaii ABI70S6]